MCSKFSPEFSKQITPLLLSLRPCLGQVPKGEKLSVVRRKEKKKERKKGAGKKKKKCKMSYSVSG